MNIKNFEGQVAIITGVGNKRGIGYAVANVFAEQGIKLMLCDIDEKGVNKISSEISNNGGTSIAYKLDITDISNVESMVEKVIAEYGRVDILVNNAGISQPKDIWEITINDFKNMLDVNVLGLFYCTQKTLEYMKKQEYGRIINLSSVSAKNGGGLFGGPHYCATKAAVLGLSKSIAKNVATHNITVNCVSPGSIDTDITKGLITDVQKQFMIDSTAVKRLGQAKEVADTILFLASKEASFITGEDVDINGGSYMD